MKLVCGREVDVDQWRAEVNVAVDMIGKLIMLHGGSPVTAHRVAALFYEGVGWDDIPL